MITLFLDFDGVLHPYPTDRYFTQKNAFEDVIRPYVDKLEIVITSSWRYDYPIDNLKALFSSDVAKAIKSVTPLLDFDINNKFWRSTEIELWLEINPRHNVVVLDDLQSAFAPEFVKKYNVIFCKTDVGLDKKQSLLLKKILSEVN